MERGIDDCREIKVGGDWLMSSAAMLHAVCMFNIQAFLSSIAPFLSQNVYPTSFAFTFPVAFTAGSPFTALSHHSHPYCNDSLFLSPSRQPHIIFILFCPCLSSALPSSAPGCDEWLAFGGWQALVCVSEISHLKSQTWQIDSAIQKWTITSERRKNYKWKVMRSSRVRLWGYEYVVLCADAFVCRSTYEHAFILYIIFRAAFFSLVCAWACELFQKLDRVVCSSISRSSS